MTHKGKVVAEGCAWGKAQRSRPVGPGAHSHCITSIHAEGCCKCNPHHYVCGVKSRESTLLGRACVGCVEGVGWGMGVRRVRAGPRGPAEKRLWAELGAGWRTVSRMGGVVGSRSRGTAVAGPWAAVKDGPSRSGHIGWHTSWWRMYAGSHPAVRPAARALSDREQTGVRNLPSNGF